MSDEISKATRLEPPGSETTLTAAPGLAQTQLTARPGDRFGRYKILEEIGQGGCGVVFVAEQEEPVRRRVALKVIKLGMDTRQVIARFEAERQALAMMDHPNIARVLDAGATDTGRPFFVMELVRGIKITDYCDQKKLSTPERLKLFIQVCQAVQHAHQKGIIHRDLKPSNILVTVQDGVATPKVIDFGIAKATADQKLTDKTIYTAFEQFLGTPAYMSPEQAEMSGVDVDTRSDIYSLGVLLYELLTGETPFSSEELLGVGLDAMRHILREKDPARPSTKLSTMTQADLTAIALHRQSEPPKLIKSVRGDLDWIVMKCLEKDRTRRYETANGLALDLRRHLNNETVLARPPSTAGKFQKAFRRNKLAFAAGTAVFTALCLGIIATTLQSVRATHATQQAVAAQASESKLREQAQAEELTARKRAYASDMSVAMQALNDNNAGQALDLLNRQRPKAGQEDLRGWEWRYLWQQTRSDALFTLCQQSSEIESLAISSDGSFLAVGAYHKGGVSVWDLRTLQEVAHLAKNDFKVWSAFSPAEPLLAFTSINGSDSGMEQQFTLHLWNAATRKVVAEIPSDGYCAGLAFSKDGKTLVTSQKTTNAQDGQIILWRASDGTKLASYPVGLWAVDSGTPFAVTPDLRLAAQTYDPPNPQKVCVVDLRNGKQLWSAVAAPACVLALAFSPDGKMLASAEGFDESDIDLWDVATGRKIGELTGHNSWVGSLVFWPDGKKLASASADQTIRIWDVASQKCLDVMRGHRDEVWRLGLLPDNKTLVSGAKDGSVCFWDTSVTHARQGNTTLPGNILAWTFAPDSRSVLTLDRNGDVTRWTGTDLQEKTVLFKVEINKEIANIYDNLFSRDGHFLAIGSTNGIVSIWDVSRQVLWRQVTNTVADTWPMCFVADGNKLVTGSLSSTLLHEWNLTTGLQSQSWPWPSGYSRAIALSSDEQLCIDIGQEGDVADRNLTGENNIPLRLDILGASGAAFSPDGKFLAAASDMGYARVWDMKTWKEAATLRGFILGVHSVAFSSDGKRMATGGGAGAQALKLWDTDSWQNVGMLQGSGSVFDGSLFSRDGNGVGTLSYGGVLHVWRAPSWEEIAAAESKEKTQ